MKTTPASAAHQPIHHQRHCDENIKVPVPSLAEQKKFVNTVEGLEKQIADAQAIIDTASARKEAVMKKHL